MARPSSAWWRIDSAPPPWRWDPFPAPRNRFDPVSGRFRVRYAANRAAVAARERFPGRIITERHGDLWLVELGPLPPALHLTHQVNLDVLGLDDRVSTGRLAGDGRPDPDPLLDTCAALSDRVYDWWEGRPPPLLYRSRTTPGRGRNACFAEWASPPVLRAGRLRTATALLAHLVLHAGFAVPPAWLE